MDVTKLLKSQQVAVASDLANEADKLQLQARVLADRARAAGLTEYADSFDIIADGTTRTGLSLDSAARLTFLAARRSERPLS